MGGTSHSRQISLKKKKKEIAMYLILVYVCVELSVWFRFLDEFEVL